YMARLKGVDAPTARRRAQEWLERVQLEGSIKKRCEELSKGMQQKVQFAAALIHEPHLIILDEPFSGLDPVNARLMRGLIQDLQAEGRTFICSTHVRFQAGQMGDRIETTIGGLRVLDGTLEEIRERFTPRTLMVRPGPDGF